MTASDRISQATSESFMLDASVRQDQRELRIVRTPHTLCPSRKKFNGLHSFVWFQSFKRGKAIIMNLISYLRNPLSPLMDQLE